jgi:hypothetical protein
MISLGFIFLLVQAALLHKTGVFLFCFRFARRNLSRNSRLQRRAQPPNGQASAARGAKRVG